MFPKFMLPNTLESGLNAPVVIALGGHAISAPGRTGDIPDQWERTSGVARVICESPLIRGPLVIVHGNGPQIGSILTRVETAADTVYPLPLDICIADSQGGLGYMLQNVLGNEMRRRHLQMTVTTTITQTVVSPSDLVGEISMKPVGPVLPDRIAEQLSARGQQVRRYAAGWRRVVASPIPSGVIEIDAIKQLLSAGTIPICGGGGGIPVVKAADGTVSSVVGIVDKDYTSALIAEAVGARLLVFLTAVDAAYTAFGTVNARPIRFAHHRAMEAYSARGEFGEGTMYPKVQAAIQYTRATGGVCLISDPEGLADALAGDRGTTIHSRADDQ